MTKPWHKGLSLSLLLSTVPCLAQEAPVRAEKEEASADPDARAAKTLAAMTTDEKIDLLHGPMPSFVPPAKRPADMILGAGYIAGVKRLGIPPLNESDASLGVANLGNKRAGDVATALPSGLAIASGWWPEQAERAGAMIGGEARAKGFNVLLAGGVNLTRETRNGRNFEYLGEDPLLAGTLAGYGIRGVQSARIISTIKHFALNAQETGRNSVDAVLEEAALRESDLLAFQIAMEIGRPGSVMCAYNRVNGEFACENDFLLNQVLRRDWGFKGFVMSDWGAVHSTRAITKGLDQQSGEQIDGKPYFSKLLRDELAAGTVPMSAVDTAASRILRTMYAYGLVDHPIVSAATIDYAANAAVAQQTAEAGIVLLKNEGGLLPIATSVKRIAVIGGHADIGVLSGGGSSQVRPVGGPALEVRPANKLAAAFASITYTPSSPLVALREALPHATIDYADGKDQVRAVELARSADLVIAFGEKWAVEAVDAEDMTLGDGQDAVIAAVAQANPRTIVVLETGNAVTMPWLDKVGAVVEAWYPGQRGGNAIARVLTGAVNPSGRLPLTFPASLAQTPNPQLPGSDAAPATAADRVTYGLMSTVKPFEAHYPEGSDVGYRWFDRTKAVPLFAFGHGLSYTRFAYSNLKLSGGRQLRATFDITNTGPRAGVDVAQVYASAAGAKRLIGWQRVALEPGETRQVSVTADLRLLSRFDEKDSGWHVSPGNYRIEVAKSAIEPVLTGATRLSEQRLRP